MEKRKWKIIEALNWASSFLKTESNAPELLLAHLLQIDRAQLFLRLREPCPDGVLQRFQAQIAQHKQGVPIQYLIGEEQFFGRSFFVNEAVLIPRPETEELVQAVLEKIRGRFQHKQRLAGCDVGTGSGAIAVTLACEEKSLAMTAIDISEEALAVAKQNAERLKVNNIAFFQGDLLQPAISQNKRFDVIVSNPPYIETDAIPSLDISVRGHEPIVALDGGKDGCDVYRKMIAQLPSVVNEQALIGFEVGAGQSETVADLLREQLPDAQVEIIFDLNQKDRIVMAEVGF